MKEELAAGSVTSSQRRDTASAFDRWALSLIQRRLGEAPVRLVLWDGTNGSGVREPLVGRILIRDRPTLLQLLWDSELYFGEAYMAGRIEVQGDLVAVLDASNRGLRETATGPHDWRPRLWRWYATSLQSSRRNIHHHYDIGNDFYQLWLDHELVYTCAYFPTPTATLEEAQTAKMDLVCRKLRLRPGERVVEAGCGWGALALFMARRYGVFVRAYNISHEQIRFARERARAEGLESRVEFVDDDYRKIDGRYDAFVSVGMLEHVGAERYDDLGTMIDRALDRRSGRGLLHFIGRNQPKPLNSWIRRRIFPGAYPPVLREVVGQVLEPWDFSVVDVENLRLHYARTLEHWLGRFNGAADRVAEMFDERFVRAWRLYLAGSQAAFQSGWTELFQVTFTRAGWNGVAWTRDEFLRPPGH